MLASSDGSDSLLRVAMFSGGSGSGSISRSLVKNPQIQLTNIINAYDDGLSTGRLRHLIPGYLGPSDVRKNITTLMPTRERELRSLRALLKVVGNPMAMFSCRCLENILPKACVRPGHELRQRDRQERD